MSNTIKFTNSPIAGVNWSQVPFDIGASGVGIRTNPITSRELEVHYGLDIGTNIGGQSAREGVDIFAVAPGKVIDVRRVAPQDIDKKVGYGNFVVIEHQDEGSQQQYTTRYAHMQQGSIPDTIVKDAIVTGGQKLGKLGNTGKSSAPHLHFELRVIDRSRGGFGTIPIQALPFLKNIGRPIPITAADIQNAQSNIENARRQVATSYTPPPPVDTPSVAISPFIGSLESFHPKIQYELTRRRVASETANTYMPFVKLTALMEVENKNLDGVTGAWCPSLGIHEQNDVSFEDIYLPQSKNKSCIGYATALTGTNTPPTRVKVFVDDAGKDQKNIPMPGITQINAERGTAGPMGVRGGLLKADIKIVAYSVGQVDALLKYFLRPATRVVLEMGRKSSSTKEQPLITYDWKQEKTVIQNEFTDLIKDQNKQKEFITKYVYGSFGNYEIFLGYVVKFNLKYNKNNTYEIDLVIHSVQQFEVPTKHTGVRALCASPTQNCRAMDIEEYFNSTYSWKDNSFSRLMQTYNQPSSEWRGHIIPIKNDNSNTQGAGSTAGGTRENEYFVSWRFFVEQMLNNRTLGLASVLGSASELQTIIDLGLLRPMREPTREESRGGLVANEVGYHPYLRSTNPEVMVIYNPKAQQEYLSSDDSNRYKSIISVVERSGSAENPNTPLNILNNNSILTKISGSLDPSPFKNVLSPDSQAGATYLTRGVWINTKAIKQAFMTTDTVSSAINNLLMMMNTATEGYWNLQLYSTDVNNPGMHVIDMGLSKRLARLEQTERERELTIDLEQEESTNPLNTISGIQLSRYQESTTGEAGEVAKYIYMFNRKTKLLNDGELGSDVLDMNVEFNLPQVVAIQAIANVGGPAQKSTLQSLNIPELEKLSLIKNIFAKCPEDKNAICTEPRCINDSTEDLQRQLADAQYRLDEANRRKLLRDDAPVYDAEGRRARDYWNASIEESANAAQAEVQTLQLQLANIDAQRSLNNPNLVNIIREYADLGTALELIESNPSKMMKKMNLDSTNVEDGRVTPEAHAFNSSNLTKTIVDVTLPGIGGISLFQSFLVDRVPSILDKGFYVVTKMVHEFSSDKGWITKIQGRFRYRGQKKDGVTPSTNYNIDCSDVPFRGAGSGGAF